MAPEIWIVAAALGLSAYAAPPEHDAPQPAPQPAHQTELGSSVAAETASPETNDTAPESATPSEPAGLVFQASRIAPREALWMLEWTRVQGRSQIAQQWRQLRQQYPQWMSERFIIARPLAGKKDSYTLFIGNFSSIELGEELCEILRAAFPACQVWPAEAIGGTGTSLKMSLQLTLPESSE